MKCATFIVQSKQPCQFDRIMAFCDGLEKHSWKVNASDRIEEPADLICFWGVRRKDLIQQAKDCGAKVCVLELGYMGDRNKYTSVSFGGELNNRAEFRGPLSSPDRFIKHFNHHLKRYDYPRKGYALIAGQVEGDESVKHLNLDEHYKQLLDKLKSHGYTDIRFRPHPLSDRKVPKGLDGVTLMWEPLEATLNGSGVVATVNSNFGVDAVLHSCPVLATDEGSMVWHLANDEKFRLCGLERIYWAYALSWKQWSVEEFRSGECWEAIGI